MSVSLNALCIRVALYFFIAWVGLPIALHCITPEATTKKKLFDRVMPSPS